jgi:glycosyltransferase involved in cell wall biosynthesis
LNSGKKRIFVDAHMFDHGFEGTASFIHGLYLELLKEYPEQYKIYLGCLCPERVLKSFGHHPAFEAVPYGTANRYRRLLFDIPRITRKLRPDLAHFQYFTPLEKNCPWHVTLHDVLFNDFPALFPRGYARIRNILFPLSARRADLLSTVSQYSRERLVHWYGCRGEDITIIPNGTARLEVEGLVPTSEAVAQVLANPAGYLLCVSRFEPRKNQSMLLQAYIGGRYWARGIQLVFVGSRTLPVLEFEQLWREAPEGAKAQVKFLSGLPYADIQLLNAKAKVSVYPSYAEGFGMPPLESAIHGTPSLCAGVTGMAEFEFLKPFFFNPADFHAIQHGIDRVLEQPETVALQMRVAMDAVRARYNWCGAANILHQAMARFGPPAS